MFAHNTNITHYTNSHPAVSCEEFFRLKLLVVSIQQKQEGCSPCNAFNALQSQSYSKSITNGASLQQNIPNPFSNSTTINYNLPSSYSSAKIIISDKKGDVLKQISLSAKGNGNIQVDA